MVKILEGLLICTALLGLTFFLAKNNYTKPAEIPALKSTLLPDQDLNLFLSNIEKKDNQERIINLTGPIDFTSADEIVQKLYALDKENHKPILMKINSGGGIIYAGLEIYDTMQYIKSPVRTQCVGVCMSMASIILTAGQPGYRTAMPHSTVLMHTAATSMEGHIAQLENELQETKRLQELMYDIFVSTTKMNRATVIKESAFDNYISPEDALKKGLIDKIESPAKK